MVHAEAKAQGTLKPELVPEEFPLILMLASETCLLFENLDAMVFSVPRRFSTSPRNYESAGHGLLFVEESDQVSAADASNSSLNMTSNTLQMCGAAALNIYADVDVTGFALPAIFRSHFDSDVLVEELTRAVTASADALVRTIVGPLQCMPGANTVAAVVERIRAAARAAADHIRSLIPTIDFDLGLPSIQLLSPKKLFCKEVYTTPDDFESAPCAAELGCKHAGRGPPPGEELPEPEQVRSRDTRTLGAVW